MVEWILMLPDILVKITNHPQFEVMWSNYQAILTARSEKYEYMLTSARVLLMNALGISEDDLPRFTFIPNLLQAPYMADYEVDDREIGIIQNVPYIMAIIHEALHILFKPYRNLILKDLKNVPIHKIADIESLELYGKILVWWNLISGTPFIKGIMIKR